MNRSALGNTSTPSASEALCATSNCNDRTASTEEMQIAQEQVDTCKAPSLLLALESQQIETQVSFCALIEWQLISEVFFKIKPILFPDTSIL